MGSWIRFNNQWIDADIPQIDIGESKNYIQAVQDLSVAAEKLRIAIPDASSAIAPSSATTPVLRKRSTTGSGYALQGGCTDGTYIYYYIKAQDESNAGTFVKMLKSSYSIPTGNTKSMSLYHCNDMTYNPVTGYIYAATTQETTNGHRIAVIDPDTMTVVSSKYIPNYISSIAYEPMRDVFICAWGGLTMYVYKLDEQGDFQYVRTLTCSRSPSNATGNRDSQGIACDSAFIYHAWSKSPNMYIEIFDWFGNYIGTINKSLSYSDSSLGSVSMEVEWIDKTSKNGFIMGTYAAGEGSASPEYIYTFTMS